MQRFPAPQLQLLRVFVHVKRLQSWKHTRNTFSIKRTVSSLNAAERRASVCSYEQSMKKRVLQRSPEVAAVLQRQKLTVTRLLRTKRLHVALSEVSEERP
ncbi:hypothetical protein KUCAC02_034099 [Chaenocephalus aceratus]|nr:hypothetical protein KUCAC02_034099 [Chaenocephalus aceratus]